MTGTIVEADVAMVQIIAGPTGVGKTTYSVALAQTISGVRFSIDQWMGTLFWMDSPEPIQYEWTIERINRCEQMMFTYVKTLAALGIPSVLDLGFAREDHRRKFATWAREFGLATRLHWLDASPEERWARVQTRNVERGATYAIDVDRDMFDFMEDIWEAPTPEEMESNDGVRIDSS